MRQPPKIVIAMVWLLSIVAGAAFTDVGLHMFGVRQPPPIVGKPYYQPKPRVYPNKWHIGRVTRKRGSKMGTYNGDVNPYPIVVTLAPLVSKSVSVTVPVPAGSVVTAGTWHVAGSNTGGVFPSLDCVAPDATSHYLTSPGDTAMTADDIAGINNNSAFTFTYAMAISETCTSDVSVTLTGTFPPPPPPAPTPVAIGNAGGLINLCLLNIQDMNCEIPMQNLYLSQNISSWTAPFGVQILRPENVSFLTITPGLVNLGGTSGNLSAELRIYREIIGSDMQWIQNPNHIAPPIHCQLAAMPVLLPWDGAMNIFIEVQLLTSAVPANSAIELAIAPIRLAGGRT